MSTGPHAFANADPSLAQQVAALWRAQAVAERAMRLGRHPFGALLLAPDHETVLAEQGNIDTVNHAEATLARTVASHQPPELLWNCTLVTTFEPCAMCAATAYWANIGRIVYGASEEALLGLTGSHPENPTLSLPSRELFARGQKPVRVFGPVADAALQDALLAPHRHFWSGG
ncbi:nucleoside deaminase [Piscinibacter sakaiensis]|uniref:Cytidine/deoxycytidylate deaminase family protein n=1 Tax=Piscinibacter sakaiensis TaxID=1547922 RepID=A0A0K8P9Z2_PISS1|nr:nucleoside deaminase [Piscinibacter sakaiensis]GAP38980.1 cytidine/deoxycytidylate deaminase family protein [Piscinibacter sakaiensis]